MMRSACSRQVFLLLSALALVACGDNFRPADNVPPDDETPAAVLPDDWADQAALTTAEDINPDPGIVEVELTAQVAQVELTPGVMTEMYTYNGVYPGPLIEAEVGQRLIVHFTNLLPEETTVHWHGVELPASMDGSNLAQEPVPADGGTFTYEFDLLNASTYWYHPHIRGNEQVEKGLLGSLVVRDPEEDAALGLPQAEMVMVLDDILLAADDTIEPPLPSDPVARAAMLLNGREGNTLLVNGRTIPTVKVLSGTPVRMRLVNTANARFFRVSVDEHRMYRIGGDAGLIGQPVTHEPVDLITTPEGEIISNPDPARGVLLVPGERADVVFTPIGEAGSELYLQWHDIARGLHTTMDDGAGNVIFGHAHHDGMRQTEPLVRFEFVAGSDPAASSYEPPGTLRPVEAIDVAAALGTQPVTFGHTPPNTSGDVTFFSTIIPGVGGVPFDQLTPDQALHAKVGDTWIIEVTNLTGGDHPFHLHGFFFQHIETLYIDDNDPNGPQVETPAQVENKDTILIPRRPGAGGTTRTRVRLAVTFDDTGREGQVTASGKVPSSGQSGGWVLHCHILEHADRGMMTFLELAAP